MEQPWMNGTLPEFSSFFACTTTMPFQVALYKGKESPSGPRGCPMQPVLQSDNLLRKMLHWRNHLTPPPEEEGPFLQHDYSRSGQHLNLQKIGVSNNDGQLLLRGF